MAPCEQEEERSIEETQCRTRRGWTPEKRASAAKWRRARKGRLSDKPHDDEVHFQHELKSVIDR